MIQIMYYTTPDVQRSGEAKQAASFQAEPVKDFRNILKEVDAMQETREEREERRAEELKSAQQQRERSRRIAELRSLIAMLQSRLNINGYSQKIAAELSAAQNELYWLMFQT